MSDRVDRINQLDALNLDREYKDTLYDEMFKAFEYFKRSVISKIEPEMKLLINFFFFRYTIAKDVPEPGNKLQNLKYVGDLTEKVRDPQKLRYFLLGIFGSYVFARIKNHVHGRINARAFSKADPNTKKLYARLEKIVNYVEKLFKLLEFVNLLVFLKTARYRSLLDRICGITLVAIDSCVQPLICKT
eukprot:TRINITY_DN3134_c0_g1_i2.p2 TRINITY_DN3134_c0_g1~~TRINITY_DN3134_c0_g1_i2.p2  ORF type:complete len:188 (+),score=34.11 TRINITY_DN3134_c0_g1_i2:168-731(+)